MSRPTPAHPSSSISGGATTMEKLKLQSLISQIDPAKRPLYILLPAAEYQKFRTAWKLP
jgi:hypothetical protein